MSNKPKGPSQNELLQFAFDQLGGQEEVVKRYRAGSMRSAFSNRSTTVEQLIDQAGEQGWLDILYGYTLRDLSELLAPQRPKQTAPKARAGARGKLRKADKDVVVAALLDRIGRLAKPQPSRALLEHVLTRVDIGAIDSRTPLQIQTINTFLKTLVEDGQIKAVSQPKPKPTLYGPKSPRVRKRK